MLSVSNAEATPNTPDQRRDWGGGNRKSSGRCLDELDIRVGTPKRVNVRLSESALTIIQNTLQKLGTFLSSPLLPPPLGVAVLCELLLLSLKPLNGVGFHPASSYITSHPADPVSLDGRGGSTIQWKCRGIMLRPSWLSLGV